LFVRVPRLVEDLALARASGAYSSTLAKLARIEVLILDDFLLAPMKDSERRDLLEVLEDRYERSSTVITSQLPSRTWHSALNDPTIADAICDRLVHNAHLVELRGPSMRKEEDPRTCQPLTALTPSSLRSDPDRVLRNSDRVDPGMGVRVDRNTH